jgi:4-hydroxy-3-methylbut-2-enyl diphosphate reductase
LTVRDMAFVNGENRVVGIPKLERIPKTG